jgi:serine/threonine-protein kinase
LRSAPSQNVAAPFSTQGTVGVEAVIAEKYELLHILGRGAMGEVWLARHNTLFENVAIKLLAPWAWTGGDRAQAIARFRLEARIAAHLARKTRHIVQVTDHGEVGDTAYIVMELLEGLTLEARLSQGESLPIATVQKIVRQVARALEYAHAEGVLHRDLKPANIFLTRGEDGEMLVKVLDFGIAQIIRRNVTTGSFSTDRDLVFGTPGYMSPEQALGHAELDRRCDLWALATIAFESLTGELPVPGITPNELVNAVREARTVPLNHYRPDLPESLWFFFERAFAKSADARFATATDLTNAFDAACIASTLRPPSIGSPGSRAGARAFPPRRRHPIAKALALSALVATGLFGLTTHWRPRDGFRTPFFRVALASLQASAPSALVPRTVASIEPQLEAPIVASAQVVVSAPVNPPPAPVVRAAVEKRSRARRVTTHGVDIAPVATPEDPSGSEGSELGAVNQSELVTTRAEGSSPAPSCSPPYEVDATGKKHWKLDCL